MKITSFFLLSLRLSQDNIRRTFLYSRLHLLTPCRRYSQRMFTVKTTPIRRILFLMLIILAIISYSSRSSKKESSRIADQSKTSIRILYVVRTNFHFYPRRLIYLLQTWISLIFNDVFFVTDISLPHIPDNQTIITKQTCGSDAHAMGILCCKTAHDFLLFRKYVSDYHWFCHFDDDQYVNVEKLEEYLSTFDSSEPYYIGRTSWSDSLKRSKEPFPNPFWFATLGAGVCLSKATVYRLQPFVHNASQFVDGCIRENYHDDIYLGFLLSGYLNINLTKTDRFHSHLEEDFYSDRKIFLQTFTNQITFGFRSPNRYPYFLPLLYPVNQDPYRIRTLHCLLYPTIKECQKRLRQQLFNSTKQ